MAVKRVFVAGVVLLLAGCSSSGKPSRTTPTTHAPTASGFATTYGQDAALIASHITGCAGVAAADVGDGAASGMVGKATCTLTGHQVIIYTWKDAASQSSADAFVAGSLKFFATGTGWDQILGDDAAPDAQQAIAAVVAKSLGGTVSGP